MSDYITIIIVTFVGFVALAALLLVPVYRFLKREERAATKWTDPADFEAAQRGERPAPAAREPERNGA